MYTAARNPSIFAKSSAAASQLFARNLAYGSVQDYLHSSKPAFVGRFTGK
jgi:hypothetical protein